MARHFNTPELVSSSTLFVCDSKTESVHVDTSTTTVSLRLPKTTDQDISPGCEIYVVDVGGNLSRNKAVVNTDGADSSTISGSSSVDLTSDGKSYLFTLHTDGNWRVVESGGVSDESINSALLKPLIESIDGGRYRFTNVTPEGIEIDTSASSNPFNNTISGLSAGNTEAAINELTQRINALSSSSSSGGGLNRLFLGADQNGTATISNEDTISVIGLSLLKTELISSADGPVVRVKLNPGANGQVLTTDASGAVVWSDPVSGTGGTGSTGLSRIPLGSDGGGVSSLDSGETMFVYGEGVLSTELIESASGPVFRAKVDPGAAGQILTTNASGAVVWAAPTGGGGTGGFTGFILDADTGVTQFIDGTNDVIISGSANDDGEAVIITEITAPGNISIGLAAKLKDLTDVPAYPTAPGNYNLLYNGANLAWTEASASTESASVDVSQVAHGFTALTPVFRDNDNGDAWTAAIADVTNIDHAAVTFVSEVVDADNFKTISSGPIVSTGHGLNVGEYYWLSTSGGYTDVKPTTGIIQELFWVQDEDTILPTVQTPYVNSGEEIIQVGGNYTLNKSNVILEVDSDATSVTITLDDNALPIGSRFTIVRVNGIGRVTINSTTPHIDVNGNAVTVSIIPNLNDSVVFYRGNTNYQQV